MRAKLKRRARGVYQVVGQNKFFIGITESDADGKRRWVWHKSRATTATEAKRERERLIAALDEGRAAPRSDTTFEQAFENWLAERPNLGERSIAHSRGTVQLHLRVIARKRIQDVTRADLVGVLRGMGDGGYSAATIAQVHRLARGVFAYAQRTGLVVVSPAADLSNVVPKQTPKKRIRRLTPEEVETLIAATKGQRWKVAVALAGFGGLRLGELRGVKWSDIDFAGSRLRVVRSLQPDGREGPGKTDAAIRVIPMLPRLAEELLAWQVVSPHTEPSDFVLTTVDAKPLAERNLRRALKQAVERSGLTVASSQRLSWHSLRHSAGSTMVTELGLPITTTARVLGHRDPSFTYRVYVRDARDDDEVVADMLGRAAERGIGVA